MANESKQMKNSKLDQLQKCDKKTLKQDSSALTVKGPRILLNKSKNCKKSEKKSTTICKNEKRAMNLNIPISIDDIINLSKKELNKRLANYDLSENQLGFIRDIRYRGKSKITSANCHHKRRLDNIPQLADERKQMKDRKPDLLLKRDKNAFKQNSSALKAERPLTPLNDFKGYKRSEEEPTTVSKDEQRAMNFNIPFSIYDIINLSRKELNKRLAKYNLSENQLEFIRYKRHRGKSKMILSAKCHRKRRLDNIPQLTDKKEQMKDQNPDLLQEPNKVSPNLDQYALEVEGSQSSVDEFKSCNISEKQRRTLTEYELSRIDFYLPISIDDILNLSKKKFEKRLTEISNISSAQIRLMRDIRTRGKIELSSPAYYGCRLEALMEKDRREMKNRNYDPFDEPYNQMVLNLQSYGVTQPLFNEFKGYKRSDEGSMTLTKHEPRASYLDMPFSIDEIINMPGQELKNRLAYYDFSESQLEFIKDVRYRGKMLFCEVDAQNIPEGKSDKIPSQSDETKPSINLAYEEIPTRNYFESRESLNTEIRRLRMKCLSLTRYIFNCKSNAEGNPYAPETHMLIEVTDGHFEILPRTLILPSDHWTRKF